ncbi:MAG: PDZ domain-containing protein [Gemmatimonadetes bacterium]|nr:PDZ domain-containing protein [Gemmatimonadota bacterium]
MPAFNAGLTVHKRALSLMLAAVVAAPTLAAQGRATIRTRTVDPSGRDSTVDFTVRVESGDILRLISELMTLRQAEERLAKAVREVRSDGADGSRLRDLESQLSSVTRRNAGLMSAVRFQCARDDMQPDGYLGVSFEGIEIRRVDDGPVMYSFGSTPHVISVEPGSPADLGGLAADDEIVSIAGYDARKPVPLGALLKPGAKLVVRVLRSGQQKDISVAVGKRPEGFGSPCAGLDDMLASARWEPQTTMLPRTGGSGTPRTTTVIIGEGEAPRSAGNGFVFMTPFATAGPNLIGGAQFLALDAQWRETLGVDQGLLVLSVAAGSPAEASGLRKSDVIVAVGDSTVSSVGDLWRLVDRAGPSGLTLRVRRAKQLVTVVFKTRAP